MSRDLVVDAINKELAQLKRLVITLSARVKKLEQENVRIKHDARQTKAVVASAVRRE